VDEVVGIILVNAAKYRTV